MGGPLTAEPPAEPANAFLSKHREKEDFNQYWYSQPTIKAIVQELLESCTSAAFLSTPSLYFSLPKDSSLKAASWVFDYDQQWSKDQHYVWYDFHKPDDIPAHLHGTFDCCVMDPPFITEEVWEQYAAAARILLKPDGKVVCSTVAENAGIMQRLFNAQPRTFKPSIPHLVYQYNLFTNYTPGSAFNERNPEVPEDD